MAAAVAAKRTGQLRSHWAHPGVMVHKRGLCIRLLATAVEGHPLSGTCAAAVGHLVERAEIAPESGSPALIATITMTKSQSARPECFTLTGQHIQFGN